MLVGRQGMGHHYLASAALNALEGYHVQSFDLASLLSDSTRSAEAAVVQLFIEAKRHIPSVIFIPNVDVWFFSLAEQVRATFVSLLKSLSAIDPILLFGTLEADCDEVPEQLENLFGYGSDSIFQISQPNAISRLNFFKNLFDLIKASPSFFPNKLKRRDRALVVLEKSSSSCSQNFFKNGSKGTRKKRFAIKKPAENATKSNHGIF